MINFDSMAAACAARIIEKAKNASIKSSDIDTRVTTAMNILTEQGIYAMFLWIREKS